MNNKMTLGSLFDGSGGFPLAALQLGIRPLWACEIEPFAIRVTTKNFHKSHTSVTYKAYREQAFLRWIL